MPVFLFRVCQHVQRAVIPAPALYFNRVHGKSSMHTLRPELLDERNPRPRGSGAPDVRHLACPCRSGTARTLYMRLFILNDMMDSPGVGDEACFRRHVKALRGHWARF